MNDNELLRLLSDDPEKGLGQVFSQYGAYVWKIAVTRLEGVCTKEDIEEAVSDVFIIFYDSAVRRGFEIRSVKAFLSVIAVRHCTDVFRKACKKPMTESLDELGDIIAQNDITESGELLEKVRLLGEPDSSIIIRRYYFGQKNKDIAKETGLSPIAVSTRLSRGLVKLRKLLEEEL